MSELASRMMKVVENVAERFSSKPLKAHPVHNLDEAMPSERKA